MKTYGLILALRLMGLGWYVALSIVLGTWGGIWLDGQLETLPIFTLVGVVMGSVVAFYGVYRMVAPFVDGDSEGKKQ